MFYKSVIFIFCVWLSGTKVLGQDQGCNADPIYQLMDFWVGEWQVYGPDDQLVGKNQINKILNGCAVMEHWEDHQGGKGKSLFYVDNDTRKWKQVWVTENANQPWGQKEKALIFHQKDSVLIFQGSYVSGDVNILDRTILTKKGPNEVQQTIQVSQDGGVNWRTTFDALYKK